MKQAVLEGTLSIGVSFLQVGVDRRLCRCAATFISVYLRKTNFSENGRCESIFSMYNRDNMSMLFLKLKFLHPAIANICFGFAVFRSFLILSILLFKN